jgi:hypothetical protein
VRLGVVRRLRFENSVARIAARRRGVRILISCGLRQRILKLRHQRRQRVLIRGMEHFKFLL